MGVKPPGVAAPKVMLSKPIWLDVPPKSIEKAVPANDDPIGTNGQNKPLGSCAPLNGVYPRLIVVKRNPGSIRAFENLNSTRKIDRRVKERKAGVGPIRHLENDAAG